MGNEIVMFIRCVVIFFVQKTGFFVECGGYDGEITSNTLLLEKLGWEGLIVEADPDYFFQSLGKNRKVWKLNAALCPSTTSQIVSITPFILTG